MEFVIASVSPKRILMLKLVRLLIYHHIGCDRYAAGGAEGGVGRGSIGEHTIRLRRRYPLSADMIISSSLLGSMLTFHEIGLALELS